MPAPNDQPHPTLNVIQVKRGERPYVVVDKGFAEADPRLSWKAKGLLLYLLCKPAGWRMIIADLVNRSIDGEESVRSGIKELVDCGYLYFDRIRDKGKFVGVTWNVYERFDENPHFLQNLPQPENPDVENLQKKPHPGFPDAVKPDVVNPGVVIKDISKEGSSNIGEINNKNCLSFGSFSVDQKSFEEIQSEKLPIVIDAEAEPLKRLPDEPPTDKPKRKRNKLNNSPDGTTFDNAYSWIEDIRKIYPKKADPANDRKAIDKAITKVSKATAVSTFEAYRALFFAAREYASVARDIPPQYIPHCATWFNGARYEADPATWNTHTPANGKRNGVSKANYNGGF